MFKELFALRVLVASFTTICIFKLTSPFINVWLGAEYILPQNTVAIIALYSGICIGRGVTDQFLHAYGLYADIWSPYIESAIMILVAVICGYAGGLPGVLCGPVASMGIVIYIWKPYYLFHSGLHISVFKYWSLFTKHIGVSIISFIITNHIYDNCISAHFADTNWLNMIMSGTIFATLTIVLLFILYYITSNEFRCVVFRLKNHTYK